MTQLRDTQLAGRRSAIVGLWVRSVVDLIATASGEHLAEREQQVAQPANPGVTVAGNMQT